MKNILLFMNLLIGYNLYGQTDTIIDEKSAGTTLAGCSDASLVLQGTIDTSCYYLTVYSTNFKNVFYQINTNLQGDTIAKGFAMGEHLYIKYLFFRVKRKSFIILKNGEWSFFYSSGIEKAHGAFKNDERDGIWLFFGEDGSLIKQELYDHGVLQLSKFH